MIKTAPVHYHLGQFPPQALDWPQLIPLIGPANAGLARYDGLLSAFRELLNIAEGTEVF
jgi:hypothetical protein